MVPAGDVAVVAACALSPKEAIVPAGTVRACIVAGAVWIERDPEPNAATNAIIRRELDLVQRTSAVVSPRTWSTKRQRALRSPKGSQHLASVFY